MASLADRYLCDECRISYGSTEQGVGLPSMSDGLSRSIRRIRPVDSAKTKTLLATWAATKSEEIENWSCTFSTLKMGKAALSSSCMLVIGPGFVVWRREPCFPALPRLHQVKYYPITRG